MPIWPHDRRDLLRGIAGSIGFAGGVGVTLVGTAGSERDSDVASDGELNAVPSRIAAYPSLDSAERAIAEGDLVAGDAVDVLGQGGAGDGGGFRGVVLEKPSKILPGAGLIEPVDGLVDVRMFGPTDSPGASTRTLQQALNWSSERQHIVRLSGRLDTQEPLVVNHNAGLVGLGAGFRSGLRPVDCPALILDGDKAKGGWVFNILLRDFSIWGDRVGSRQPYAMRVNQCYRSAIENVIFRGYSVSSEQTASVVAISGKQNQVVFDRVSIIGRSADSGGCGIWVANAADAGHVQFSHVDVEKTRTGIIMAPGARAQFLNPYFERLPTAIKIVPGIRSLVIQGGIFRLNNQNSPAIQFDEGLYNQGEHIALIGIAFQPHQEDVLYPGIVGKRIIWANPNHITMTGVDQSSISISGVPLGASIT